MYALCPICGHKLLKGNNIENVEIKCPRCSHFLNVSICGEETRITITEKQNKDVKKNT